MIDRSIRKSLCIADRKIPKITAKDTFIADLSAAFCMKRCRTQDNTGTLTIVQRINEFTLTPDRNNHRTRGRGILREASGIDAREIRNSNRLIFSTCTACPCTLLLHLTVKALIIQGDSMFVKNLLGEFPWESIGIVELETNLTVQNRLMRILQTGDFFIQKLNPLRQRRSKPILFHANYAFDIILFRKKFAEILCITENINDCIYSTVKEWLCDSKHTSMTNCTAKRAAQNVAAPLV